MITKLQPHQVFVYGANLAGRHGAGAAKQAMQWGAVYGRDGLSGQTYGICTKDAQIRTLPLHRIQEHVSEFLYESEERPQLEFLVTRIGCGLAGYTDEQIAPMFRHASANVKLPELWVKLLSAQQK
ncbi:MAG: hypothetical protein E6Q97_22935 [Desulfurellales bacterium]|nr:MAG: hypothetical protein E6Q97_22935 [Desulfurellales bacterium]